MPDEFTAVLREKCRGIGFAPQRMGVEFLGERGFQDRVQAAELQQAWFHRCVSRNREGEGLRRSIRSLVRRRYPRPTKGIFVAMTVMNCTFASSGRLAM